MNRNTVRRNFSITERADMALEEMSDEWDMSRSAIVSKAVLEYTDKDRTARIEEKLDDVLDRLDAPETDGGTVSENQPEKEKVSSASDTHTFDPFDYDPDADRGPLSKDEVKELIRSVDEPIINPDHVDDRTLSTNNNPTIKTIAGIIRYNISHARDELAKLHPIQVEEEYLPKYWDSRNENYYLKFTDPILDEFHQHEYLEPSDDGTSFTTSYGQYYVAEADREAFCQQMVDGMHELLDQPFTTRPGNHLPRTFSWAKMVAWLKKKRSYLLDHEIASEDEIDSLIDQLQDRIEKVDKALDVIREEFGSDYGMSTTFKKEEAIDAMPYDEETSTELYDTLRVLDQIDVAGSDGTMELNESIIVRPE